MARWASWRRTIHALRESRTVAPGLSQPTEAVISLKRDPADRKTRILEPVEKSVGFKGRKRSYFYVLAKGKSFPTSADFKRLAG
jgi:hypothetical protein